MCDATNGNPDQYQYTWTVVPKYGGENQTVIGQNSVEKNKVTFYDAGNFICEARNNGGSVITTQTIEIKCNTITF